MEFRIAPLLSLCGMGGVIQEKEKPGRDCMEEKLGRRETYLSRRMKTSYGLAKEGPESLEGKRRPGPWRRDQSKTWKEPFKFSGRNRILQGVREGSAEGGGNMRAAERDNWRGLYASGVEGDVSKQEVYLLEKGKWWRSKFLEKELSVEERRLVRTPFQEKRGKE